MQQKSVEKNYVYNLIYQMLVVVIPLITTPYVGRVLNPDGIGAYSYTTAMTGYFALFGNLGIATYGQLRIARERDDKKERSKTFHELALLRIFLNILVISAFLIFIFFISKKENQGLYLTLIVQIIASMMDISWFLQGLEEFKKIVLRNTIIKLLSVVLIFSFVKSEKDLYLYALIMNGSTLLGNLSIWLFMPSYIEKIPFKDLQPFKHFRACVVYFIPTIATTIYLTLDKTMLGWFTHTSDQNGYYEQAQKIEQMAVTVVTSLSVVTMPRMAYLFKQKETERLRDRLYQTISFIMMISIPMCLGMIAVSDYFIPLYLGNSYRPSIILLKIFSLLLIVIGLNNAVGKQILMPVGRQNKYNEAVIIGAVTNFFMNLLLIPHFYAAGAAIASVVAETVILIIFTYESRDYITGIWMIKNSIKYVISGAIMFITIKISYLFLNQSWISLIIQIIAGIVIYFVCILVLKDKFAIEFLKRIRKTVVDKKM